MTTIDFRKRRCDPILLGLTAT